MPNRILIVMALQIINEPQRRLRERAVHSRERRALYVHRPAQPLLSLYSRYSSFLYFVRTVASKTTPQRLIWIGESSALTWIFSFKFKLVGYTEQADLDPARPQANSSIVDACCAAQYYQLNRLTYSAREQQLHHPGAK
jgi:hypothetical protein